MGRTSEKKDLTDNDKRTIVVGRQNGLTMMTFAGMFGVTEACISQFLKRRKAQDGSTNSQRTGRPRVTGRNDDRNILKTSRTNPRLTAPAIRREVFLNSPSPPSVSTVKRRLKAAGIMRRRPVKKPLISEKNRADRVKWAKEHLNWTRQDWNKILWSDESKFLLFGRDGFQWERFVGPQNFVPVLTGPVEMLLRPLHPVGSILFRNQRRRFTVETDGGDGEFKKTSRLIAGAVSLGLVLDVFKMFLSSLRSVTRGLPVRWLSTAAVRHFLIKHYAGNVHYNIDGWVEKNRDHVETSVLELLSQSTNPLVKSLFPPVSTSVTKSRRGTLTTQSTVTYIYKNQLQSLLNTLNSSSAHFVRCVVPNHDRVPGRIDGQLVLDQLRCNGVLEAIRICRQGYPSRLPHSDFVARYKLLGGDELLINKTLLKTPKEACRTICQAVELDESRFCVGKTKMFCKVGVIAELESLRRARIANFITKFQAHARYGFAQKELESKRSSSDAVLTIQHNVRIFSKLSQWPWLRIFQLSRALIPRDRERLRIKELEKETMTLRDEIQELESRNQDTKQELDKLNLVLERERAGKETLNKSVEDIKKKLADKERQVRKTLAEMEQNEDVFSLLEKKYNEQHQKVMKMNDILREYERRAEQFDMEKADLEKELRKSSEKTRKEVLEKMTIYDESQGQVTKLLEENSHFRLQIAKLENEVKDEKARNERQNNTIGDLQKLVTELNEKIARFDGLMLNEKNLMRRAERDKDQLKEELKAAKELIERQAKKIDQLKTHLTQRDNDVKRLERKLEDKDAMMKDCVQDLKESHKERVKELEQKMDDFKRRNSKLENENSMQKSQIETFERESSVDSDYGRSSSGRMSMSHIGRQYSLTSMGSFSSLRTIGLRRKDSESDLTSSMYSLRRRDSLFDLPTSPPSSQVGLQRSPSTTTTTSAVMEKERRIQELEKEKAALKTDLQLVRRELEVYKSQMTALEMEKESLQTMVRKQTSTLVDNTRQLNAAQKNVDNLELRLKRALDDSQVWKKKHEDSVSESKQEILAERKRASERTVAVEKENELKQSRISSVEMAKNELSVELTKAHAEIDRCRAIILQLEENLRSQETLGGSFESHQRNLQFEVESLRDENCALKAKIRRQYKQIEMLTHQDGTSDELAHFQQKLQRMEER
ncbi:unnamed protein product [Caenorhabditis auriculariae]|uniref:Myosin motor domain-containing protein n=1 Tax=Caenorhabditis auriculariae TaxID=2777116 RepID=A0A8S1HWQ1_9PELO|nr:unnamed protein product [Caenorhabditis auriculariae]